jgi:hypothetical protein
MTEHWYVKGGGGGNGGGGGGGGGVSEKMRSSDRFPPISVKLWMREYHFSGECEMQHIMNDTWWLPAFLIS